MTAHPIGMVRPPTTIPATQTSHGPRRVVSSATTIDCPGGSNVSAAWSTPGLPTVCSDGGPVHQRRTRVSRARPLPAWSAGRARASAAAVTRWATSTQRTIQAVVRTTVACVRPSMTSTHARTCSYPTAAAVILLPPCAYRGVSPGSVDDGPWLLESHRAMVYARRGLLVLRERTHTGQCAGNSL